jgi:hypothetical protein
MCMLTLYYCVELKMSSEQRQENTWVLVLYELFVLHIQSFKKDAKPFPLDPVVTAGFFRFVGKELNLQYKYNTVTVSDFTYNSFNVH